MLRTVRFSTNSDRTVDFTYRTVENKKTTGKSDGLFIFEPAISSLLLPLPLPAGKDHAVDFSSSSVFSW